MTGQRRLVAEVLLGSQDHPDAETLLRRIRRRNPKVSAATVYRTLKLLEEVGMVRRHEFAPAAAAGARSARFEVEGAHHDHLIDEGSGEVVEFYDEQLEQLQHDIARRLGYRLTDHRMELYGVPLEGGVRGGKVAAKGGR